MIFWFCNFFFIYTLEFFYKDLPHINYLASWEDGINVYFFINCWNYELVPYHTPKATNLFIIMSSCILVSLYVSVLCNHYSLWCSDCSIFGQWEPPSWLLGPFCMISAIFKIFLSFQVYLIHFLFQTWNRPFHKELCLIPPSWKLYLEATIWAITLLLGSLLSPGLFSTQRREISFFFSFKEAI